MKTNCTENQFRKPVFFTTPFSMKSSRRYVTYYNITSKPNPNDKKPNYSKHQCLQQLPLFDLSVIHIYKNSFNILLIICTEHTDSIRIVEKNSSTGGRNVSLCKRLIQIVYQFYRYSRDISAARSLYVF